MVQQTRNALELLKNTCEEKGIDLRVIILPELHNPKDYPFKKEHDTVIRFLSDRQIHYRDLLPYFKNVDDPESLWVAPDDAHPNARGHRLIAQFSEDFLKLPKK